MESPKLRVFVASHCAGCAEARAVVAACRKVVRSLDCRIVDVDLEPEFVPESVVAVPAYELGGEIIHLGNPSLPWLLERLGVPSDGKDNGAKFAG